MVYLKLGLLGLAIATGTCVMYVASASAHRFLVEKHEVKGAEVFSMEGNTTGESIQRLSEVLGKISGEKVSIRCEGGKVKDEIEKEGLTKGGELLLEKCSITEIKEGKATALTACTVANIPIKFKDTLLTGQGVSVEIELQPSSGKLFAEFELSGASCSLKGKVKLESATEGKGQICTPASAGEVESSAQFFACGPTGSKELRLDGEKAGLIALMSMSTKCPANRGWYME
jgi:hypothetical protein